ncbi:MAG: hypothetical protein ACREX8_05255 [Gammaproteobacteria bacterium]
MASCRIIPPARAVVPGGPAGCAWTGMGRRQGGALSSFNPADGQATIEELDSSGAPVYVTGGWCDAHGVKNFTIKQTIDDVRNLGKIFAVPDRAE